MLDKLFNDKKFLFLFSFLLEFGSYYLLQVTIPNAPSFSPELRLYPILGLMFGPIGPLGASVGILTMNLYLGYNIIASLIDSGICFFIGIMTYKLWYSKIGKLKPNIPRFNSALSILKLLIIMIIITNVFFILIFYSASYIDGFDLAYTFTDLIDLRDYSLSMLYFSLLFGLMFISIFNILKIPLQFPKKWRSLLNIDNKYILYGFLIALIYSILSAVLFIYGINIGRSYAALFIIVSILCTINKMDMDFEIKNENYFIIEYIIITFILILVIAFFATINDFRAITDLLFNDSPLEFRTQTTLAYTSVLILILSLVHIHYIEKTITNPMYDLIDALNKSKVEDMINTEKVLDSRIQGYLDRNDDFSRLVNSMQMLKNNIRSYLSQIKETKEEKERMETEFNVSSKIQSNMIKTDFDEFSKNREFEIFGLMNPAKEVGGDFYDYFNIDEENIGFVIGDVCGKGISATLLMVKTMYLIRNHSQINENPEIAMSEVNDLSCERNDENLFVTAFYGKLNFKTGKLTFVNAGHNPPLIKRNNPNDKVMDNESLKTNEKDNETLKTDENSFEKNDDENNFEYLKIRPNFVIGGMEEIEYEKQGINLKPGDIIFMYSDGITDTNNDHKGFYGDERLRKTLNHLKDKSLEEIVEGIKEDVHLFCDGKDQFDDVTMLIIKYIGCENNE